MSPLKRGDKGPAQSRPAPAATPKSVAGPNGS
jgi:hypothetical protein